MNPIKPALVVFALGCGLSGKGTALRAVHNRCPGSLLLEMSSVLRPIIDRSAEHQATIDRGELLHSSVVIPPFKSLLLRNTHGESRKQLILCDGACRNPFEVPEYFEPILLRRDEYKIVVCVFDCFRPVAAARAKIRMLQFVKDGKQPRKEDLADKSLERWHDYQKNLPSVLDAIRRYERLGVKIIHLNANQPKEAVAEFIYGLAQPYALAA